MPVFVHRSLLPLPALVGLMRKRATEMNELEEGGSVGYCSNELDQPNRHNNGHKQSKQVLCYLLYHILVLRLSWRCVFFNLNSHPFHGMNDIKACLWLFCHHFAQARKKEPILPLIKQAACFLSY